MPRYLGMTHAYDGLGRAFPYVVLEPEEFVADSSNELVDRISYFFFR